MFLVEISLNIFIIFLCFSFAASGWLVPQFAQTYQKLIAAVIGCLAVLAITGWLALRGKTGYDSFAWYFGILFVGFGVLTGGFTQFWILFHRDNKGPRPGESKIRMILAGVSILALLLLILSA